MGRGAIPSLRRFARRRMRGSGVVGCYPRFPAAIPEEGAGSPRVTQPFATRFPPRRGAVRLACVRRAASVHPEPGSNSPSKVFLGADEPVRPAVTPIGSIRNVKAVSCLERNRKGSPYSSDFSVHHCSPSKWFLSVCLPAIDHASHGLSPRSIRFSRYAPPGRSAPRGKEIYCHTRRRPGPGFPPSTIPPYPTPPGERF